MNQEHEIDLIVPWVDGNDPQWQQERNIYQRRESDSAVSLFRDWGLLRYWFRGVERNLTWIRQIHFITQGHLPPWLNTGHPRLNIVRHCDYIPHAYLPTYSSHPIELCVHRIPGCAEQFILSNDDTFFIGPVDKTDYFRGGLPCDFLHITPLTEAYQSEFAHIVLNCVNTINRHTTPTLCKELHPTCWSSETYPMTIQQSNNYAATLAHFPGFAGDHFPNPYLKSTFKDVWNMEHRILNRTCMNRFRTNEDVSHWLMRYWQLVSGTFTPCVRSGQTLVRTDDSCERLRDILLDPYMRIVCINEGTSNIDFERRAEYLRQLLEMRLPEISSFELT